MHRRTSSKDIRHSLTSRLLAGAAFVVCATQVPFDLARAADVVDNGTITLTCNFSICVDPDNITGTGNVQVTGFGTVVLTGTDTYTGGSIVPLHNELRIGDGGISGSIVGNVTGSGTLGFDHSDTYLFTGSFTGGGILAQRGAGTLIVTSDINYAFMTAGTLQFGNGGTTGSLANSISIPNNSVLAFDRSDTYAYVSIISGAGALEQIGSGTLVLSGLYQNSYTGGTTIASGTLQIGDGGANGVYAVPGDVTDNSVLAFNSSASLTIPGNISGTGVVKQIGSGATTLTGTATNAGGIVVSSGTLILASQTAFSGPSFSIQGGTLQVGNGGNTGSISGDVSIGGGGTLSFFRYDVSTYSGNASGAGALSQTGQGIIVLTGTNTYTGGTTISNGGIYGPAGTLQIGNGGTSGSIIGDVNSSGTLIFDRSDSYTFAGNINGGSVKQIGSGTLVLTGDNNSSSTTIASGSTLQIGSGGTTGSIAGTVWDDGTLIFNRSDSVTLNLTLVGAGNVTKLGPGTLTLNSGTDGSMGKVQVSAGTLVVGDSSHADSVLGGPSAGVQVQSGATLKGFGTINGPLFNNGGTVAPGGPIGTLTSGTFNQSSSGTLEIEVSTAAASKLHVTQNGVPAAATLGGTLKLDIDLGTYGTRSYTILDAASVSGTFATVTTSGAPTGEAYGVQYTSTAVNLVVQPLASAQIYSDFVRESFNQAATLGDFVFTHLDNQYCREAATDVGRSSEPECPEVSVWRQGVGGSGSYDGNSNISAFSARWAGLIGGIDYHSNYGFWLGLNASLARNELGVSGAQDNITTDSFSVGVSGGLPVFNGRLDSSALYILNASKSHRLVTPDGESPQTAGAHPKDNAFAAAVQYSQPLYTQDLMALARLSYTGIALDSFHENGAAPFDYSISSRSYSSLYADVGLKLSHVYTLRSGALLIPDVSAGVRNQFGSASQNVSIEFADLSAQQPPFTAPGAIPDRVAFTAGLGVTAQKSEAYALYIRANGRLNGSEREGIVSIGGWLRF